MRMWNVDVRKMCRQHLLGEHFELHKFVNKLGWGRKLNGFIERGLMETHNIEKRHNEIVKEMLRRGFKHNSPLKNKFNFKAGYVDAELNKQVLIDRCKECRRMMQYTSCSS